MKTLKKVTMSNIRQHLLPFERYRIVQTLNCYNYNNIAATLTKMLPTHSAAHDPCKKEMTQKNINYNEST